MIRFAGIFVHVVDRINYRLGRLVMYGIFVMVGILLWSSISKTLFAPSKWTLEVAQFALVAYYVLGGPYSMQLKANVRMDLFYGNWSIRKKAWADAVTVLFLIFYLGVLLYGALDSTAYSLGYFGGDFFQFYWGMVSAVASDIIHLRFGSIPETVLGMTGHLEKGPTSWHPYIWPIKVITVLGFFLMLLQALSELVKDIAVLNGFDLRADEPTAHLHMEND